MPPAQVFPHEVVRDLLGIVRSLYRATLVNDPKNVVLLQELVDIGQALNRALDICARLRAGTPAYNESWRQADRACKALGKLANPSMHLSSIVRASAQKAAWRPFRDE